MLYITFQLEFTADDGLTDFHGLRTKYRPSFGLPQEELSKSEQKL